MTQFDFVLLLVLVICVMVVLVCLIRLLGNRRPPSTTFYSKPPQRPSQPQLPRRYY